MMRRLFWKTRGSISIFLVIILLPTLLFSGLVIDFARINLIKPMVSSAGDMAMNAALANYDTVVKDVYGLFAMSQAAANPQAALQENISAYFKNTLISSNIFSEVDADDYVGRLLGDLQGYFENPEPSDFMNVNLEDFSATYLKDSSLANPKIIKKEIVEYMKYRAPIKMGESFLESLAAFSKLSDQAKVTETKLNVDDKLAGLTKANKTLYDSIKEFDLNWYSTGDLADSLSIVKVNYEKVTDNVFTYHMIDDFKEIPVSVPAKSKWGSLADAISNVSRIAKDYPVEQLDHYGEQIDNTSADPEKFIARIDFLYAFEQKDCITQYGDLKGYHDRMVAEWNKMNTNLAKGATPPSKPAGYDEAESAFIVADTALKKYHAWASATWSFIQSKQSETTALITGANSVLSGYLAKAESLADLAEKVKKNAEAVKTAIDDVQTANQEFGTAVDTYQNGTKDNFGDTMASEQDKNDGTYDVEAVEAVIQRAVDNKTYFESVATSLKEMKFGGVSISSGSIKTWEDAKVRVDSVFNGENVMSSSAMAKKSIPIHMFSSTTVSDTFAAAFTGYSAPTYLDNAVKFGPGGLPKLKYYDFLKRTFPDSAASTESTTTKTEMEDMVGKSNTTMTANTGADEPLNPDGTTGYPPFPEVEITRVLPSSIVFDPVKEMDIEKAKLSTNLSSQEGTAKSSFSAQSGVVQSILGGLKQITLNSRDNLYVSEYIFNNFSYSTMDKEYKALAEKAEPGSPVPAPYTLSRIPINKANNKLYGGEIEYILYGKHDVSQNVMTAKGQIFAIRMVMNSIYAFTNAEIRTMTSSAALAISVATGGIAPVPLVQAILQLALAMGESALDLIKISNGLKVAIYKSPETWTLSGRGVFNEIEAKAKEAVTAAINDSAVKLQSALQGIVDSATEITAEQIANLQQGITNSVKAKAQEIIDNVCNQLFDKINLSIDNINYEDSFPTIVANLNLSINSVETEIDEKIQELSAGSPLMGELMSIAKEKYVNPYLTEARNTVQKILVCTSTEQLNALILSIKDELAISMTNLIDTASDSIGQFTNNATMDVKGEITSLFNEGSADLGEQLKGKTMAFIDNSFSNVESKLGLGDNTILSGSSTSKTGVSSALQTLLTFGYQDYLRMFMFIGLTVDGKDGAILKRVADVIQININCSGPDASYTHVKKGLFEMNNAFTYVEIQSNTKMDSLLLDIPFFQASIKQLITTDSADMDIGVGGAVSVTDSSYRNMLYHGIAGY